jgi:hypothetical protein
MSLTLLSARHIWHDQYRGEVLSLASSQLCRARKALRRSTEIEILNKNPDIKVYRASRTSPMTRDGIGYWLQRYVFGKPPAIQPCEDVGLPWKQEKE